MTTTPSARPLLFGLVLAIAVAGATAGCSAGSPGASSGKSATPAPAAASDAPSANAAGGGGSGAGSGVGAVPPVDPTPVDPAAPEPTLVIAKPGQLDPHPVSVQRLEASVDGHHVLVKITWTSGVEPCNVLDSVRADRSAGQIAVTVIEGSSARDAMCIEIAMIKATIVDLGDLAPGTWTISALNGEAEPVVVTIA